MSSTEQDSRQESEDGSTEQLTEIPRRWVEVAAQDGDLG